MVSQKREIAVYKKGRLKTKFQTAFSYVQKLKFILMPTRRTQNAGIHILNIAMTGKRHGNIHFFIQDFQRTGYAFFAIRTQTIQERPAYIVPFAPKAQAFKIS